MVLQAVVVLVLALIALGMAFLDARQRIRNQATAEATAVAKVVAHMPEVASALTTSDPTALLQPLAEGVRADTGVDFIVVMTPQGRRYTHPDKTQIGGQFLGDLGGAPNGEVFTQEFTGTLGPSVRAVVPVIVDGRVTALVAVGITLSRLDNEFWRSAALIGGGGLVALLLALGGSVLIARRVRRQTYGLDETALAQLFEFHNAVLHSVREGLLLLDSRHRLRLVNAEATRLLGVTDEALGRPLTELGLPAALVAAASDTERDHGRLIDVGAHTLLVGTAPAVWEGRTVGAVVTLRDRTELLEVTGELDATRRLSEALRSQQHESANRLHTLIQLVESGRSEEALDFADEELQIAQLRNDQLLATTGHPALSALLLGKTTEAAVFGVQLDVIGEPADDRCPIGTRDLITVAGNLVDNALDALNRPADGRIAVAIVWDAQRFRIVVDDNGPGVPAEARDRVLQRGWSTKSGTDGTRGIGLALVQAIAQRHHGWVRVDDSSLGGARFTVELKAAS